MGIFVEEHAADTEFVLNLCKEACVHWNERFSNDSGYIIDIKEGAVEGICRLGEQILRPGDRISAFPERPSAFKRVATLMISLCVHPLLVVLRSPSEDRPQDRIIFGDAVKPFVAEYVIDLIPMVLSALEALSVDHEGNEHWVPLVHWRGFVTTDFKDEFIKFLYWLENTKLYSLHTNEYDWAKLERIVLITSLVLEASYGPILPARETSPSAAR
jgi:hypothetical protein